MKTEAQIREKMEKLIKDPDGFKYRNSFGPFINALRWVLSDDEQPGVNKQ